MIDPPRLRDDAASSIGEMLSAARADGPRDCAADKRRLLAALAGLEAPPAPTSGTARHPDARSWARWSGAIAGVGLAVVGVIGAMSMSASTSNDPVAGAIEQAPAAPEPTTIARAPEDAPPAVMPSVDVADLPTAARAAGSIAPRRPEPTPMANERAVKSPTTTADELAFVERIRTELAAGDARRARRDVADYRATFLRGRFVEEIDALEVEALAADGARTEARAKAAEFAARYPSSPYARRVRSVIASLDGVGAP